MLSWGFTDNAEALLNPMLATWGVGAGSSGATAVLTSGAAGI